MSQSERETVIVGETERERVRVREGRGKFSEEKQSSFDQ